MSSKILINIRHEAYKARLFDMLSNRSKINITTAIPIRTKYMHNRHRDPKYRLERKYKLWPVDLPDFDEMRREDKHMTPEQMRTKFKEKGVAPPRNWDEREVYSPCTVNIIEQFKPPQDGEKSSDIMGKLKSPLTGAKDMIKKRRQMNEIKTYEGDDFNLEEFLKQSKDIYIRAHEALAAKDDKIIFDYVTEFCFPLMTAGLNRHTIFWKYLGDVEPPEVMQVRTSDVMSKGNKYAQITVRMYSKQLLAVYDRHGRLVHGSPTDVKEVLEYVVFEKYLANEYGLWRIHGRIKPRSENVDLSQQVSKTYVVNKTV